MKLKKLKTFCKEQDISYEKGLQIAHSINSPCYKIDGRWFIDEDLFEEWLRKKHIESFKWA